MLLIMSEEIVKHIKFTLILQCRTRFGATFTSGWERFDQGSALGSQSHGIPVPIPNFGIGIGIGIDFSEFWDWDWDWDRFFKILGLGLGLGSIFQKFGIGIGLGIRNSGQNPKKSQESQEIPKVLIETLDFISMNY